jgi:hypothetical protein
MVKYDLRLRHRPREGQPHPKSPEGIKVSLRNEERLLQSISARAPIPEVLNKICSALNYQIGNVISFIFLEESDVTNPVGMAGNARPCGLYTFRSAKIIAGDGKLLGALEMYCCVPCSPTSEELSTIERAECLAAIAIERHNEERQQTNHASTSAGSVP